MKIGQKHTRKSRKLISNKNKKYRYLKAGEVIKEGDEYKNYISSGWQKTTFIGEEIKIYNSTKYRRPIKSKKAVKNDKGTGR